MRRRLLITAFAALRALASGAASAEPFAYVSNFNDGTISVIDTASDSVTATVRVGESAGRVAANATGTRVYAVNGADSIAIIDAATNVVETVVPVGLGPVDIAVNPSGTQVFVANSVGASGGTGSLSIIDTASDSVVATVRVGDVPAGVAASPDGTWAYVTTRSNLSEHRPCSIEPPFDCTILFWGVDALHPDQAFRMTVGGAMGAVAVDPAGARVYVAGTILRSEEFRVLPALVIIDPVARSVVDRVALPGGYGGAAPSGVAVHPLGTRVYVSGVSQGDQSVVAVVDTMSDTVAFTIPIEGGVGLAVTPDGSKVYVASGGHDVFVIDTAANAVVDAVQVGSGAVDVAIGPEVIGTSPTPTRTATPSATSTPTPRPSSTATVPPARGGGGCNLTVPEPSPSAAALSLLLIVALRVGRRRAGR